MADPLIAADIAMTTTNGPATLQMPPSPPPGDASEDPYAPLNTGTMESPLPVTNALLQEGKGNEKKQKRATNKGRKYEVLDRNFWFQLCRMFDDNLPKYGKKQALFLAHSDSGTVVENTNKFRNKMSRWYRKYKDGSLIADEPGRKRNRPGEYEDVGERLIAHLNETEDATGAGLSWEQMRIKAREISVELGRDDSFKASSGWLHNVLRKANKLSTMPNTTSKSKLEPITPIQALHYLSELRRYCSESNCIPALDTCDNLDAMLRLHSAGTNTVEAPTSKKPRKESAKTAVTEATGGPQETFMPIVYTAPDTTTATVRQQQQTSIPHMLAAAARATAMMSPNGAAHMAMGAMAIPTTLAAATRQSGGRSMRTSARRVP
jgi:hypothetical protein